MLQQFSSIRDALSVFGIMEESFWHSIGVCEFRRPFNSASCLVLYCSRRASTPAARDSPSQVWTDSCGFLCLFPLKNLHPSTTLRFFHNHNTNESHARRRHEWIAVVGIKRQGTNGPSRGSHSCLRRDWGRTSEQTFHVTLVRFAFRRDRHSLRIEKNQQRASKDQAPSRKSGEDTIFLSVSDCCPSAFGVRGCRRPIGVQSRISSESSCVQGL